jgi:fibronectin-binding autotransporter adhesin
MKNQHKKINRRLFSKMEIPIMKRIASIGLLLAAGSLAALANVLTWDPALNGSSTGGSGGAGTWTLSTANWYNGTSDVGWLDNSANGTNAAVFADIAGTVALNTSLSASNLLFNTTGYTLSGSGSLTLSGGINASALSSGSTTVSVPLLLPAAQQLWQVGSGATLAVNSALTRSTGASVDFSAAGIITGTSPVLANDTTGMMGAWATVGDTVGTGANWASNSVSGGIVAYTEYTDISATASSTQTGSGASTQNWLTGVFNGANYITTLSGSATIHSIVQQGDFSVANGATLIVGNGGWIFSGPSRWMLDSGGGTLGTAVITSGAATGEFFLHTPNGNTQNGGNGNDWRIWPRIQDNGATPVIVIKDGIGMINLENSNSYSGGTFINNGVLVPGKNVSVAQTPGVLGTGPVTINAQGIMEMGYDTSGANNDFFVTNSVVMNGGKILADDGHQHVSGPVNVLAAGGTFGSSYDGGASPSTGNKGFFVDGVISGSGPLYLQQAQDAGESMANGNEGGNAYNSSFVCISNNANTFSGTIFIVPYTTGSGAGSYLAVNGSTALQYATVDVQGAGGTRFVGTSLIFNTSLSLATLGGLTDNGNVILNGYNEYTYVKQSDAIALTVGNNNSSSTYSGVISGSGSLTKAGTGTLTMTSANTYAGNTTVNGGDLILQGGLPGSTNYAVAHGATLDVSALSFSLASGQTVTSVGTINGSVSLSSGSGLYTSTGTGYGTNAITGSLTLASGALVDLQVGTVNNGSKDLITVAGTVTANGNIIHIAAPSTSASLQAADYPLITSANAISGSFSTAPSWDVQPANASHYSVVTSGNTVVLHYAASSAPSGGGTATPASADRNQTVFVSVTATNGNSGTVNSVTVDASAIGGSTSVTLVAAGGNVWTNNVVVGPAVTPGAKTLVATLTDTASLSGAVSIPLTVTVANDVWNGLGANGNFDTGLNWVNTFPPGYVGDSLEFAGTRGLTPDMDNNYSVTGVTFDSGAGSFNIGSVEGDTLTLTGSGMLADNAANPQTLNVAIADAGGGVTKTGTGMLTLAGNNTYTGPTVVSAGTLNISGNVASTVNTLVGSTAGNSILDISGSASLSPYYLLLGNISGSTAAVYQTGGTVTATADSGYDNLSVGNLAGTYGYYDAVGGTATINGLCVGGEDNNGSGSDFAGAGGNGVLEINGGTLNCTGWLVVTRCANADTGLINVYSGALTYAGGGLVCNWGSGQTVMINILGGSVATSSAVGIGLGSSGTAILNLDGGLLNASVVSGNFGGTYGQVNFNGGTLQASEENSTFLHVSSATIYGGGATIDNNGQSIVISQPFLAPTGNGVQGIASFTGGAGYIAPPIVTVVPGTGDITGTGATAIAQINPLTGVVTNVIITSAGVNYTATPTFTMAGGGATTAATITGTAPTANASGGLISTGVGSLTLSGASTYPGATVVTNDGTLLLGTGGSINDSTNIIVDSGATFDVSALTTYTLAADQTLSGSGTINGSVNTTAGSGIAAGPIGTYGTNTFNNNLTLVSGAACYLGLGTLYNGANDLILVDGTLTATGNSIHLKAPSTSVALDTTADYVLISSPNATISGSFSTAPIWDVAPSNAGHYSIVTSANAVTLHYSAAVSAPSVTATASPTSLTSYQTSRITATVTPGSGNVVSVTIDEGPLGGPVVSLVRSNLSNTYTNTITIPPAAAPGNDTLTVTVTDNTPLSGSANIVLTISTTGEIWSGAGGNANWSTGANWLGGFPPAYAGDALTFAGSAGLTPNMDTNYTVPSLTFSNNAGSFDIGSANNSTLTLTGSGSIVNNSANAQTLNVTIADAGGGLTKGGSGTVNLAGNDTYTGPTTVSAGTLNVAGTVLSIVNTVVATGTNDAVLGISGAGSLSPYYLLVGNATNSAGAVYQTGGTVTANAASTYDNLSLGNVPGSYGYYDAAGGSATINGISIAGEANNGNTSTFNLAGNGIMDINGGNVVDPGWLVIARNNNSGNGSEIGILNVYSGSLTYSGGGIVGPWDTNETAIINIMGGTVQDSTTIGVYLGNAGYEGILNLNGGLLEASEVSGYNGPSYSVVPYGQVNFNGGTLQASTASTAFIAVTSADIYSGGATIDNNGNDITIAQPLLAPTGKGVNGIASFTHGSGYIAPPIVQVLAGSGDMTGFGATAIAQINPVTGSVTNVLITSPGVNYTATPAFVLTGGGATTPATITGQAPSANISGGLTAVGSGVTTLTGANTYTGDTTVNAGTLEIAQPVLAASSTVTIASGAVLQLDFPVTNTVSALVINGVAQATGVYNSTTSSSYITGSGSLQVGTSIPSTPTSIAFSVSGSTLSLSWPANYQGWILQSQTNSLSTGLSSNWVDVSGSASSTSYNIIINRTAPAVFYRLRHP